MFLVVDKVLGNPVTGLVHILPEVFKLGEVISVHLVLVNFFALEHLQSESRHDRVERWLALCVFALHCKQGDFLLVSLTGLVQGLSESEVAKVC